MGDGIKKIEMHFLPDVYVKCDVCGGKRFNEATLDILYKGRSIADVLDMTIEEALELFASIPKIKNILLTLYDVGLGYMQLGQGVCLPASFIFSVIPSSKPCYSWLLVR